MKIAVLGPGGVGGLLAALLARSGEEVLVVAQEATAEVIAERGLRLDSVTFGQFTARLAVTTRLTDQVEVLLVATKAAGLEAALERIDVEPPLVVPLLNGLDHIALLRRRFPSESVCAGSIRVEADRPQPGVVVHTSQFLLVSMASEYAGAQPRMRALAEALARAGVPAEVLDSEAQVMWSKLVRLNALACTTSAYDKLLGEIRSTPALRADLIGAMEEAAAAGCAEGAEVDAETAVAELDRAHTTLGSSMQRDIRAGRPPELDAIPGSVLRAAARHGLTCPTIERLVAMIAARAGVGAPSV